MCCRGGASTSVSASAGSVRITTAAGFPGKVALQHGGTGRICRELWSRAPASYHGKTLEFERLYSLPPFPVQPGGIPIWFGLPPTARNFERIARFGGGWYPMLRDPAVIGASVAQLRDAFRRQSNDAAEADCSSRAVADGLAGRRLRRSPPRLWKWTCRRSPAPGSAQSISSTS
mgnify:CR=1 FL=1